jgi:hypothetical protein
MADVARRNNILGRHPRFEIAQGDRSPRFI